MSCFSERGKILALSSFLPFKETSPTQQVSLWIILKLSGTQSPGEVRTEQVNESFSDYYYLKLRAMVRPPAGEWQPCSQYFYGIEAFKKKMSHELRLEGDLENI